MTAGTPTGEGFRDLPKKIQWRGKECFVLWQALTGIVTEIWPVAAYRPKQNACNFIKVQTPSKTYFRKTKTKYGTVYWRHYNYRYSGVVKFTYHVYIFDTKNNVDFSISATNTGISDIIGESFKMCFWLAWKNKEIAVYTGVYGILNRNNSDQLILEFVKFDLSASSRQRQRYVLPLSPYSVVNLYLKDERHFVISTHDYNNNKIILHNFTIDPVSLSYSSAGTEIIDLPSNNPTITGGGNSFSWTLEREDGPHHVWVTGGWYGHLEPRIARWWIGEVTDTYTGTKKEIYELRSPWGAYSEPLIIEVTTDFTRTRSETRRVFRIDDPNSAPVTPTANDKYYERKVIVNETHHTTITAPKAVNFIFTRQGYQLIRTGEVHSSQTGSVTYWDPPAHPNAGDPPSGYWTYGEGNFYRGFYRSNGNMPSSKLAIYLVDENFASYLIEEEYSNTKIDREGSNTRATKTKTVNQKLYHRKNLIWSETYVQLASSPYIGVPLSFFVGSGDGIVSPSIRNWTSPPIGRATSNALILGDGKEFYRGTSPDMTFVAGMRCRGGWQFFESLPSPPAENTESPPLLGILGI